MNTPAVCAFVVVVASNACTTVRPDLATSTATDATGARVGGAILSVDATQSRVTIREARSGTHVTIDVQAIGARGAALQKGDCLLVSGQWRRDHTFTATVLERVTRCP